MPCLPFGAPSDCTVRHSIKSWCQKGQQKKKAIKGREKILLRSKINKSISPWSTGVSNVTAPPKISSCNLLARKAAMWRFLGGGGFPVMVGELHVMVSQKWLTFGIRIGKIHIPKSKKWMSWNKVLWAAPPNITKNFFPFCSNSVHVCSYLGAGGVPFVSNSFHVLSPLNEKKKVSVREWWSITKRRYFLLRSSHYELLLYQHHQKQNRNQNL